MPGRTIEINEYERGHFTVYLYDLWGNMSTPAAELSEDEVMEWTRKNLQPYDDVEWSQEYDSRGP